MAKKQIFSATLVSGVALWLAGCAGPGPERPEGTVRYEGSSTVAIFIRAAETEYGAVDFVIDTEGESAGGESAILEGRTQLAGIASAPRHETLQAGVVATLIGRDAIAVVVNARNPVTNLTTADLRALFTGRVTNWSEVGGPDLPVEAFTMSPQSATREVFRAAILGEEDYAGSRDAAPDESMLARVAGAPGGIGQVSFSFLAGSAGVRPVSIDGEEPAVTNFDYPVSRPLYLLWREGNPVVEAFIAWAESPEGQNVVMRDFVGVRVLGSARSTEVEIRTGTLVVYTETMPVYDGGIYYYPHRSYEILDRNGRLVRHVRNHRGRNDENPTKIDITPGTYLIRTKTSAGDIVEYFVTIVAGQRTELDVVAIGKMSR